MAVIGTKTVGLKFKDYYTHTHTVNLCAWVFGVCHETGNIWGLKLGIFYFYTN